LEPFIGNQSKVSEVLNRKRPLSIAMIRALHKGLDIPVEVLLQEPGKRLEDSKYLKQAYKNPRTPKNVKRTPSRQTLNFRNYLGTKP